MSLICLSERSTQSGIRCCLNSANRAAGRISRLDHAGRGMNELEQPVALAPVGDPLEIRAHFDSFSVGMAGGAALTKNTRSLRRKLWTGSLGLIIIVCGHGWGLCFDRPQQEQDQKQPGAAHQGTEHSAYSHVGFISSAEDRSWRGRSWPLVTLPTYRKRQKAQRSDSLGRISVNPENSGSGNQGPHVLDLTGL